MKKIILIVIEGYTIKSLEQKNIEYYE